MIYMYDMPYPISLLLTVLIMFAIQFILCKKVQNKFLRHSPWAAVILILYIIISGFFDKHDTLLDQQLSQFLALIFATYAVACAVGIGLAHLVIKLRKR